MIYGQREIVSKQPVIKSNRRLLQHDPHMDVNFTVLFRPSSEVLFSGECRLKGSLMLRNYMSTFLCNKLIYVIFKI